MNQTKLNQWKKEGKIPKNWTVPPVKMQENHINMKFYQVILEEM